MRTMMASMKAAFFLFLHWGEFIRTSLTICHMVVHLRDCTVTEYTVICIFFTADGLIFMIWFTMFLLVCFIFETFLSAGNPFFPHT